MNIANKTVLITGAREGAGASVCGLRATERGGGLTWFDAFPPAYRLAEAGIQAKQRAVDKDRRLRGG